MYDTKQLQSVSRPNTLSGLANLYQVDRRTMRNWLKMIEDKLGKRAGNLFTPRQIALIYDHLGPPTAAIREIEQQKTYKKGTQTQLF